MRAAVLHLAFAGLGALEAQTSAWIDNTASQRVSLRLGYVHEGASAAGSPRRADAAPALPPHARGLAGRTTSTASRSTVSSPACRCSALHELAANLYNHATMATPTTQASQRWRGCRRAERGHRGRLGLRRPRARAPDRRTPAALAAHRAGPLGGLRRALAGRARALRRRLPLPAPRSEPRSSARRSRAPARPSSTSAPTSGSIPTGPTA